MAVDLEETIAAIATAPGGSLRGAVRISGPNCLSIVEQKFHSEDQRSLAAASAPCCVRGAVELPRSLGLVPATLYLWPNSKSYTRQPSAELHLPGSPPLLEAALEAICQAGARLARPGEFTLRAFLAGRLDLTQAEAVLGVIDAQSRRELDGALSQLAGGLARPLGRLRDDLLDLLAQLEAGLDFVEEDIDFISRGELLQQLEQAARAIGGLVEQVQSRGEGGRIARVVLIGLPNVGKSSLLNALAGADAALVSEIAGTTRDSVTRRVCIGQRDCLITDTAGVLSGESISPLEQAAQAAARRQARDADLTLLCIDASRPLPQWEVEEMNQAPPGRLIVLTKCDLTSAPGQAITADAIRTSSLTGIGIDALRRKIGEALDASSGEAGVVASTADRCRESLRLAGEALARARDAGATGCGDELVASEVRLALDEVGRVVGAVYTEDILDRVFSRFCIGK